MSIAYVLNETEQDGGETTLGVFESPCISDDTLRKYYGSDASVIGTIDICDSGLEWQKQIKYADGVASITLHYFVVGEI